MARKVDHFLEREDLVHLLKVFDTCEMLTLSQEGRSRTYEDSEVRITVNRQPYYKEFRIVSREEGDLILHAEMIGKGLSLDYYNGSSHWIRKKIRMNFL